MKTTENIKELAEKLDGLEDQLFALGKLAENLEERMRRMEQNWTETEVQND